MQIALAQLAATTDPDVNLGLVRDGVRRAVEARARVVVFPEATMCRFGVPLGPVAQPLDGPWASAVRELAADAGITVVAGMFTPDPDGRVRNTLLATGGGVEASYDKIHLYDAFGFAESATVAAGATPVTIEVDGRTVGLATCYDVRFPALFQRLAGDGADAVLLPASWGAGEGKVEQWELLVRARALDSGTFVLACDQADPETAGLSRGKAPTGVGHSLVADPMGRVVDRLGAEPGLLVVDVDLDRAVPARTATGALANVRDPRQAGKATFG
ncbi:carbon-nitrogen hydrolase family protein [Pseudonocardia benzenivorans]|uniref:Nitrilase/cyanide hydratase and apolipoprotein N-acyltransferase n=2 Tax=Pseudonocardia TaxID=1847 RepID=F4CY49_PSEUX|nr:carbon-nitrogen hydrolase family protein [Pseudonocardia dioxanivorans]AEA24671.1 Nitrilase/cyanide hydratase and apolipoprotein N-acyltransferase [Pseudonocardia dioxanivorans CB1190]